jgi:hypothetical protein
VASLYFGRPTFGVPYASRLGLFITGSAALHLFGIVLIGIGGGWLWELALRAWRPWVPYAAATAAVLLLVPALRERGAFYDQGLVWMQVTRDAIAGAADANAVVDAIRAQPPGRVFAGLRTDFGPRMTRIPFARRGS